MDNLNYLNTTNNKEFLWNLLYEKKVFNNIPNNMLNSTKEIFENSIKKSLNYIIQNDIQNDIGNNSLINLNKIIVKNLNEDFIKFKSNLLKSQETKNSVKNEKIELFNIELEKQKQNMDEILILKKPEEIDFSDKKLDDKPIDINTMNNILEKMEKERNIILNNVKNNTNTNTNTNINTNSNINDKIFVENKILDNNILDNNIFMNKIEENTDTINDNTNNKEKINNLEDLLIDKNDFKKRNSKVNFKDLNLVIDNEYKYENITNLNIKIDNIYKTLNKILENQEKIMSKLEI